MMWYWSNGGFHWWAWFLSGIGMVAFWGLVIWLIVSLVRGTSTGRGPDSDVETDTPEAVLRRRFAKGEIDEGEYNHRLDVLHSRDRVGSRR